MVQWGCILTLLLFKFCINLVSTLHGQDSHMPKLLDRLMNILLYALGILLFCTMKFVLCRLLGKFSALAENY